MKSKDAGERLNRLVDIVATLRSPGGCPWDRKQTPETILPYLIEETYEAVEAIEAGDQEHLCEELGDLLLEVALLARMAEEEGHFTITDSIKSICDKMIRRHPHVFEGEKVADDTQLKANWTRIKAEEKPGRGVLEGVPRALPALMRAKRISDKAASVGFDWENPTQVLDKVEEECAELREALAAENKAWAEEEFGDLLFSLVNLGRHLKIDCERSLQGTVEKFSTRFTKVEEALKAEGKSMDETPLEELEALWQETKKGE